jgi:hypothetical protein
VAAGVEQAAIIVLTVDFDQHRCHFAQQRGANGLVVDEATAAAVGLDDAADEQRLAGLDLDAIIVKQRGNWSDGGAKGGGDHRLRRAVADEASFTATAQRKAQGIQQDRLARAGFAGEHVEPRAEFQVKRLDQHHIANGQRSQHCRRYSAPCGDVDP